MFVLLTLTPSPSAADMVEPVRAAASRSEMYAGKPMLPGHVLEQHKREGGVERKIKWSMGT